MRLLLLVFLMVSASAGAAVVADVITLSSGEKLATARIIAIGEKTVTIMCGEKIRIVAIDEVPLDALARAYIVLEDKRNQLAAYHAAAAGREPESKISKEELAAAEKLLAEHQASSAADVSSSRSAGTPFAAIKSQFPLQRGDAGLVAMVEKYRRVVDQIEDRTSLALVINALRTMLDSDLSSIDYNRYQSTSRWSGDSLLSPRPRFNSASQQAGVNQQRIWLKNYMTPYLRRLEAVHGS